MNLATRDPDQVTNGETALAIAEHPMLTLPVSGERIDLRDPVQVAEGLHQLRELGHQLDGLRELFCDVLRLESVRQDTKLLRLEGLTALVSGGTRIEWDAELLIGRLLEAGLPYDRLEEVVEGVVTYKVKTQVANRLARENPAFAAAVRDARTDVPAPWRVAVKRNTGQEGGTLDE
jgi:hypothetical protein